MFNKRELAAIADLCRAVGGHDLLLGKVKNILAIQQFEGTVYLDIPDKAAIGNDDGAWANVATFDSVPKAVEWTRANIGACDDSGNISLLVVLGDPKKE